MNAVSVHLTQSNLSIVNDHNLQFTPRILFIAHARSFLNIKLFFVLIIAVVAVTIEIQIVQIIVFIKQILINV